MSMVTILSPSGSEKQCVDALAWNNGVSVLDADGNETQPYAGWTLLADGAPPDPEAVIVNGAWTVPLSVLQKRKSLAVMQQLGLAFYQGFTIPTGLTLAGKVLQVRDDTDRTNWLTSKDSYGDAIAAGHGADTSFVNAQGETVDCKFRTLTNETVTCTFSDGFAILQAMGAWGARLMKNSWALKDQIAAAPDEATLDAIDITQGWA